MTTPTPGSAALGAAAAYRRRMTPKQMEAEVFARACRELAALLLG